MNLFLSQKEESLAFFAFSQLLDLDYVLANNLGMLLLKSLESATRIIEAFSILFLNPFRTGEIASL